MTNFRLLLENIGPSVDCHIFRVTFESCDTCYLLNYPDVTGLRFISASSGEVREFTTRFLISETQDEFVLRPDDRISFELRVYFNIASTIEKRWVIELVPGDYDVTYSYSIDPNNRRIDYLNKGSRFAGSTKPWSGVALSNAVWFHFS